MRIKQTINTIRDRAVRVERKGAEAVQKVAPKEEAPKTQDLNIPSSGKSLSREVPTRR